LTRLEFVHGNEINTIEGLSDWLSYFEESNKESWWDEEWATNSKNQIIQDALYIHKNDLEKIDNELLKMVSDYFNNFLNHDPYSSYPLHLIHSPFPVFPEDPR
jgi:hypothetical protein